MNRFVIVGLCVSMSCLGCDYKPRNQGKSLYNKHCQSCHMENGQGLGALMPPVANSDYVRDHSQELACLIRNGISGKITVNGVTYNSEMPGNRQLTEVEVNNLIHFLLVDFNNQESAYSLKEIKEQLQNCE